MEETVEKCARHIVTITIIFEIFFFKNSCIKVMIDSGEDQTLFSKRTVENVI